MTTTTVQAQPDFVQLVSLTQQQQVTPPEVTQPSEGEQKEGQIPPVEQVINSSSGDLLAGLWKQLDAASFTADVGNITSGGLPDTVYYDQKLVAVQSQGASVQQVNLKIGFDNSILNGDIDTGLLKQAT